jgi:iron complex outermembrane recepter protein
MGPDTLWNVRDGRRNRFATYAEWETRRGTRWTELIGIRNEIVRMNAGDVTDYNSSTTTVGSAAYAADSQEFNALDHARQDINFDWTALARYEPRTGRILEFGYARKTRSPGIYERYLWVKRSAMAVNMNGWFGDSNGYSGNPNLRPEVANTFSATAGRRGAAKDAWELKITPYYTRVQNYIDVDRCPVIADGSNGCTTARFAATSGFVTLRFNHAARLYGAVPRGARRWEATPDWAALPFGGVWLRAWRESRQWRQLVPDHARERAGGAGASPRQLVEHIRLSGGRCQEGRASNP